MRISIATPAVLTGLLMSVSSCDRDRHHGSPDTHDATISAIDDSLTAHSRHSVAMIEKALADAADSVDYYDVYLRKLRLQATSRNIAPDSIGWQPMENFLDRCRKTPRTFRMKGALYNLKGYSYHKYQYNPDSTLVLYGKAYDAIKNSDNLTSLPDICANMGDIYIDKSDMPMAAQCYRRALFLSDSLRLSENDRLSLRLGLARICQNIGDTESAQKEFDYVRRNMDSLAPNMQIYFLNNYGNFLYFNADYKEAESVFNRLKETLADAGLENDMDMMVCRINLADVYLNLGRKKEALDNLRHAEAFFRKTGNETGIYYANTIRIGLALLDNDTRRVKEIIDSEHLSSAVDFNLVNIRHRYLTDYYRRSGDFRSAFNSLSAQVAHNDSLQHNITHMRTSDIMMRYAQDTLALHHEIAMKEKDVVIQRARWGLYASIVTVVMLTMLSLYIITLMKRRRLQAEMKLMKLRLTNTRNIISPHFTFNLLNQSIARADSKEAGRLMALVRLIRENIRLSGHLFITLREEIDFVNAYLDVAKDAAGGFTVTETLPDATTMDRLTIPSTFIQILVENAIKHGLANASGDKRLDIKVSVGKDSYTASVTDNGPGFDIRQTDDTPGGTGLKVIRSTIAILNRDNRRKITFSITNLTDSTGMTSGCEARLTIPVNREYDSEL